MQYRESFLAEAARFEQCQAPGAPPSAQGLSQFHAFESKGTVPDEPDPYFLRLRNGKAWWEWTVNEWASLYGTDEWPGWAWLANDFRSDPAGFTQIAQRLRRQVDHAEMLALVDQLG